MSSQVKSIFPTPNIFIYLEKTIFFSNLLVTYYLYLRIMIKDLEELTLF